MSLECSLGLREFLWKYFNVSGREGFNFINPDTATSGRIFKRHCDASICASISGGATGGGGYLRFLSFMTKWPEAWRHCVRVQHSGNQFLAIIQHYLPVAFKHLKMKTWCTLPGNGGNAETCRSLLTWKNRYIVEVCIRWCYQFQYLITAIKF